MPARRSIKNPAKHKPEENLELDLDAITRDLSNRPYNQNVDPDEPEKLFKTSIDVPESLMNQINIEVFRNKMQRVEPKTNRAFILEAIKFYFENRPQPQK